MTTTEQLSFSTTIGQTMFNNGVNTMKKIIIDENAKE